MIKSKRRRRQRRFPLLLLIPLACLLSYGLYRLPPVYDRVAWRLQDAQARIREVFNPPEEISFSSPEQEVAQAPLPSPTLSPSPTATVTASPTMPASTPLPSPTPTLVPTPLPPSVLLHSDTFVYQDQHGLYNYCAPATLSMALSFWGFKGDRLAVGDVVKPYRKDLNVMPYEMVDFASSNAGLKGLERVGGDLASLKRLLAAGFPVIVEKGVYFRDLSGVVSWMGHYAFVTGYDDAKEVVITQDAYIEPGQNHPEAYDQLLKEWQSFNYAYMVMYPPEREAELLTLLGSAADEKAAYMAAAERSSNEIYDGRSGVDLFFAWYNRGTNLVNLQDYAGAAQAYNEAFTVYDTLPADKGVRPYRILWYQTGPYFAYYYTGNYYRVIDLADKAISAVSMKDMAPEESLYWRGMAKLALGDQAGAVGDFRESVKPYHPGFEPSLYQLGLLGFEP